MRPPLAAAPQHEHTRIRVPFPLGSRPGSATRIGRVVGLLILLQGLITPVVYFRLLRPLAAGGYLATAASGATQIRVAALLSLVLGALTLGVAVAVTPLFRRHSERMTLLYLALTVAGLATLATESLAIRTMLALSEHFARAGAASEVAQTLAATARSTWHSAHYTSLLFVHGAVLVLYAILFRFALVPRALAAFGIAAAVVSVSAMAMPLLGYRFRFALLMPVSVSQIALTAWLVARGLADGRPPRGEGASLDAPHPA